MPLSRPFVFFLIFAAALGLYSSALTGQFIWDDEYQIRDNRYLTSWKYLPEIFSKNITAGADSDCGYYRPMQILSYRFDHLLWKLDSFGYHLTGLLLHASVAWIFFLLLESWGFTSLTSLFSALLFLVHPVQTEAVAYLSGRADLLAALFVLLALWTDDRKKTYALFFYVLALLSKESALIFPVLWAVSRLVLKKSVTLKDFLPYALITAGYLALRFTIVVPFTFPPEAGSVGQRLPGIFASLVGYTRVILFPWSGLHMEYGLFFFKWDHRQVLWGLGIFAVLIFALWKGRRNHAATLGLGWFLAAWLPVSGILPLHASMAEHWLYIPSLGLFLWAGEVLAVAGPSQKKSRRILSLIATVCLFFSYSLGTYRQNFYWSDPVHFSETTLHYSPDSWRAHYTLGLYYRSVGEKAKAAGYYERAFTLNPRFTEAYYNLANLLASIHDDPAAAEYYLKAIHANPRYVPAYNNLANVYSRMGEHKKALFYYKKSIALDTSNVITQKNLEAELKWSQKGYNQI